MLPLLALLPCLTQAKLFTSITSDSFSPGSNPAQLNYGVAVSDVDNDGKLEFIVAGYGTPASAGAPNLVLKWNEETRQLENIAVDDQKSPYYELRNPRGKAIGVAACDVDGDGREEVYFLNTNSYSGQSDSGELDKLYRFNTETGRYEDLLAQSQNQGVIENFAGRSVACIDRNGDGRYGIYLANYAARNYQGELVGAHTIIEMDIENSAGNRIVLKNVGEVAKVNKFIGGRGVTVGPIVTNRSDIFCDNENGPNFLFRNNGDGTFEDIADDAQIRDERNNGRGVALSDFNHDGRIDIAYGNWVGPHRIYIQGVEEKYGQPYFRNIASGTAYSEPTPIRTVIAADFDNNGHQELFMNNIDYRGNGAPNSVHSIVMPENGLGDPSIQSLDVSDALEPSGRGTGGAITDLNGDGILELLLSHGESSSQPLTLYNVTEGSENYYIRISVLTQHGAPARGATVRLLPSSGFNQMRVIDAGSGYLCQMEPVAHFGLGVAPPSSMQVEVRWPNGKTVVEDVSDKVNSLVTVSYPKVSIPGSFSSQTVSKKLYSADEAGNLKKVMSFQERHSSSAQPLAINIYLTTFLLLVSLETFVRK